MNWKEDKGKTSNKNARKGQRGNATSIDGPLRKLENFSDVISPRDEKS